jgi:hypothetical protein
VPPGQEARSVAGEICGICGGDGRIANSFSGSDARCPGCHGTGRRSEDTGLRDVTKTKPAHFRQSNKAAVVEKPNWPSTHEGGVLATEVRDCATLSNDTKAKLTREIIDHEASHGKCTQTFMKKIRKQVRPAAS